MILLQDYIEYSQTGRWKDERELFIDVLIAEEEVTVQTANALFGAINRASADTFAGICCIKASASFLDFGERATKSAKRNAFYYF